MRIKHCTAALAMTTDKGVSEFTAAHCATGNGAHTGDVVWLELGGRDSAGTTIVKRYALGSGPRQGCKSAAAGARPAITGVASATPNNDNPDAALGGASLHRQGEDRCIVFAKWPR